MTDSTELKLEKNIKILAFASLLLSLFLIYISKEVTLVNGGWVLPFIFIMLYFLWNKNLYNNMWRDSPKISYKTFMLIGGLITLSIFGALAGYFFEFISGSSRFG